MQARKKYTNKLINETSPYLLQHAHNPVDWYPWGDEAFEKAKSEDKPVLVSIGYSACHWCHVMEHESFEDEKTAAIMNENFVNIKVDMEERPDVDQIYMTFVQLTTGRGGWPMNVFLTPDKRPFFGGTYFPPTARFNMPSFQNVLASIADAYRDKRDELETSATEILGEMRRISITDGEASGLTTDQIDSAFMAIARTFDSVNGGFGGAPKFPPAMSLEFLLRYFSRTGDENALNIAKTTAEKMACGGIYDQLGGGFHRYAVDAIWLVPHFEKMLYDNAQLIRIYLHLYQITKDDFFKRVVVETLEYVKREMLDAGGGFYSSQDADSEGVEGKFFVWTPDEIASILGEDDARIFNFYYDVSEDGNFEEKNILNVKNQNPTDRNEVAQALKIPERELTEILDRGRQKLFEAREKRVKPFRDEKILTAWNGLMLGAFAEAAAILDSNDYLEVAKRNADFLLGNLVERQQPAGKNNAGVTPAFRLLRTWKDGRAKLNGYIEDYANLADGLIELYQVSGEMRYLKEAISLADKMIAEFWDEESGGFYFTSNDHEELLVRNKDFIDNATPSGNSVAADVLLKLSHLTDDDRYEQFAATVLRLASSQIKRYPNGFGRALSVVEFQLSTIKEIVLAGERPNELERAVWHEYIPNKVVAYADSVDASDSPLLNGKTAMDGKSTAYVCENFVCSRPVTSADELRAELCGR